MPVRRWPIVAVLVALVAAVAAVTLVVTRHDDYRAVPTGAGRPQAEPAEATRALRALENAVAARDEDAAAALGGDSAEADGLLRAVVANAEALDVADFTLRYVDETSSTSAEGVWTAAVDMSWRFAGFDQEPAHAEVLVDFDGTGSAATVSGIGGGDRRTPLWLSTPVQVRRGADSLVLVAGSAEDADRYAGQAAAAVPAVRAVVPDWRGGLVVEVPATAAALDAMLAAEPGTYAGIAAVSATVDGTLTPTSPAHVFVNPDLYEDLGPAGEQVVMTHEATHIATAAPVTTGMPLWLLEGFADYVALRKTELPLTTTAGQVIAQVRSDGVPDALPGPAEFDATATHLGAAYEAAWLACLVVADGAGEEALVRVYEDVRGGEDVGAALRHRADLDEAELTARWRDRLAELADGRG
jgi:hypothetical protein